MVWGLICATWNWRDDTAYVRMQTYMYNIIYNHVQILYISDMYFMFMCNSRPNLNSKPTQHEWVISSYSLSKVEANILIGRGVVFLYLYMHIKPWVYPPLKILTWYHTAPGTIIFYWFIFDAPFHVFLRTSHGTAKDGVSMTPRWITRRTMTGWSQRGLCRPKSWKRRWTKVAENMSMSEESW